MRTRSMIGTLLVVALGASTGMAQDTPGQACKRPELRDQVNVSAEQLGHLTESAQAYIDCMKPVIEAKRKQAQETLESGRAQAEAVNASVADINAFIEAFRAYQEKHKNDQ